MPRHAHLDAINLLKKVLVMARGQAEPAVYYALQIGQLAAGLLQVLQQHQPHRRTAAVKLTL